MLAQNKKLLLGAIGAGILAGVACVWTGDATVRSIGIAVLLLTAALVAVAFLWSETLERREATLQGPPERETPTTAKSDLRVWEQKVLLALVGLGVLAVGSTLTWVGWGINLKSAGPELTLPLVVIVGVVVLLVTLALVAVTFSILNMSDKGQALALPEGSVRAVIALMLLLVFAIAAIFLYSNIANSGKVRTAEKLSTADVIELKKHTTVLFTVPPFVETTRGGNEPYTVYFREFSSPAADDIAKQLIVLLGTLVTAVASFYFGSSSVASARDAADRALRGVAGPNATGVDPPSLTADGTSRSLTIGGINLQNVTAVEIVSGDKKIKFAADPGSVKASATSVSCTITVPKATPPGSYDVVVTDNTNNSSIVRISVTGPAAQPATGTLKPADLSQKEFALGHNGELVITGSGLGKVNKVELKGADDRTIPASVTKAEDGKVACDLSVPGEAEYVGTYDVIVSDDTGPVTVPDVKVTVSA